MFACRRHAAPVYLHPDLFDFEMRGIPGVVPVDGFKSPAGLILYKARFTNGEHAHLIAFRIGRMIVMDQKLYASKPPARIPPSA